MRRVVVEVPVVRGAVRYVVDAAVWVGPDGSVRRVDGFLDGLEVDLSADEVRAVVSAVRASLVVGERP